MSTNTSESSGIELDTGSGGSDYRVRIRQMEPSDRPRERLAEHSPEYLTNPEILAIILRTGTREANALDLARSLLSRFGGFAGLAEADVTALTEVPGIDPAKATEVKSALEIGQRLLLEQVGEKPRISGATDAAAMLGPLLRNQEQESLRVMLLDSRHQVIEIAIAAVGSLNVVSARMRDLFRSAVRRNCAAVILAHNHPSGDPTPSPDDLRLTETAIEAGGLLGIKVLDHVVIGKTGDGFVSIREGGGVAFAAE